MTRLNKTLGNVLMQITDKNLSALSPLKLFRWKISIDMVMVILHVNSINELMYKNENVNFILSNENLEILILTISLYHLLSLLQHLMKSIK